MVCLHVSHWNSLETGPQPCMHGHGVPRGAGQPSSWLTNDPFSKEKLVWAGRTQHVPASLHQGWVGLQVPLGILDASILVTSALGSVLKWLTCFIERCYRNCTVSTHLKGIRRDFTEGLGGCPASRRPCGTVPGSRASTEHELHSCHWFLCWLL